MQNSRNAWYAVIIFFLLYCMSFVDRFILALLATPISAALGLTDTQFGLLLGPAFGVTYAIAALPLAHLIDNRNRIALLSLGVAIWSICTICSGFSPDFTTLLVLRVGVAIGEAVLSAAAISLIADLFPPGKRTLPTAMYVSVGTFMGAGAFIVGGAALDLATRLSTQVDLAPWQLTLVLVGLPGILLSLLLFLTVPEPTRGSDADTAAGDFSTVAQALAYVRKEARLYGFLIGGLSIFAIASFASPSWMPTLLTRGHGVAAAEAGYVYGSVGVFGGILGTFLWPIFIRYRLSRGHKHVKINLLLFAAIAAPILLALAGLAPNAMLLYLAAGSAIFVISIAALVPALIVQDLAPGRMRARLMASLYTAMNLIGSGGGPVLVPLIAGEFFVGPRALGGGFAVIGFAVAALASGAIWLARKRYKESVQALSL